MTTPRTMYTVIKAAEGAGERLYERRRRAVAEAAKARLDAAPKPAQPSSDVAQADTEQAAVAGG